MQTYRRLPQLLVVLGLVGLSVSGYLAITHLGDQPIECGGVGDCNYVNSSEYADIGGVPVSFLGVAMYVALIGAALRWSARPSDEKRMIGYWALALSGAGYAAYLTYVELAILEAICVYCVVSAAILTLSLVLSTVALFIVPAAPDASSDAPAAPSSARPKPRDARRAAVRARR